MQPLTVTWPRVLAFAHKMSRDHRDLMLVAVDPARPFVEGLRIGRSRFPSRRMLLHVPCLSACPRAQSLEQRLRSGRAHRLRRRKCLPRTTHSHSGTYPSPPQLALCRNGSQWWGSSTRPSARVPKVSAQQGCERGDVRQPRGKRPSRPYEYVGRLRNPRDRLLGYQGYPPGRGASGGCTTNPEANGRRSRASTSRAGDPAASGAVRTPPSSTALASGRIRLWLSVRVSS